jgi:FecR protein
MTAGLARSPDALHGPPGPRTFTRLTQGAVLALLLLVALAAGLRPAAAGDAAATPKAWSVAALAGTAATRASGDINGAWQPLRTGATLPPGSVVMTGADSRLVLSNGVDRIRMSADSQVELPAAPEGAVTRVIHWIGTAFFQVGKRPPRQFEVDTPYLVAIVKGTKFTTTTGAAGASVKVTEGIVGVSPAKGGDGIDVTAGQAASVAASASGRVSRGGLADAGDPAPGNSAGGVPGTATSGAAGGTDDQGGVAHSARPGDSNQNGDAGNDHGEGHSRGGGNADAGDNGGDGTGHHHHGEQGHGGCHYDHGHHGHGHGVQHALDVHDATPALRLADALPMKGGHAA